MLPVNLVFFDTGKEKGKAIYLFNPEFERVKSLSQEETEIVRALSIGPKTLSQLSRTLDHVDLHILMKDLLDSEIIEKVEGESSALFRLKADAIDVDLSPVLFKGEYHDFREVMFGLISAVTFFLRKTYEDVLPKDKKGCCDVIRSFLMYHALWRLRHQESSYDWQEKYLAPNIERVRPVFKKWVDMLLQFEDPWKAVSDWSKTGIPPLIESEFSLYREK